MKGKRARAIADLRAPNSRMPPPPRFSLPSFTTAIPWSTVGWVAKLDLDSAYWTVAVSEALQRAMTAVLPDGTVVSWSCLPFGLAWAPYIFTILLDPIVAAARSMGWSVAKYLDDFVVAAEEQADCAAGLAWLRRELSTLGFTISESKSSAAPSRRITFLGLGVDLEERVFFWPREKGVRCATEASDLAAFARRPGNRSRVPVNELRSFLGRIAFLTTICPPLAVWRRHLESAAGDRFTGFASVDASALRELDFWSRLDWLLGATFPIHDPSAPMYTIRSDASDTAAGIRIRFPDGQWMSRSCLLPPDLVGASSAARELFASTLGLEVLIASGRPLYHARVQIVTDSQASAGALRRGARASSMLELGRRVVDRQLSYRFNTSVTWLPREHLEAEDRLSRVVARQDSGIDRGLLRRISVALQWQPAFDLFATASNAVCPAFAARLPEPAAAAVDGLASPAPPHSWAFPPFALAQRAAGHLASHDAPSALLAPADTPTNLATWEALLSEERPLLEPPAFSNRIPSPTPLRLLVFHSPPPVSIPPGVACAIGGASPPLPIVVILPTPTDSPLCGVSTRAAPHAPPTFTMSVPPGDTLPGDVRAQLRAALRALGVRHAAVRADVALISASPTWHAAWSALSRWRDVQWTVWLRV